jgi:N-acyl-D-aspartate/D-glutamate deacylase
MKADLVLFDPATIIDRSTFEEPRLLARGVHRVFVNGQPVWGGDLPGSNRPGRVLVRPSSEHP